MRTRKVHLKTRNGCLGCKQRHVKCGEEKPACRNCIKKKIPCSLAAITPSEDVQALLNSSTASKKVEAASPIAEEPPPQIEPTEPLLGDPEVPPSSLAPYFSSNDNSQVLLDGPRDLELFQFFITETAVSLSSYSPSQQPIWQVEIPRIALGNALVRSNLVAIASLDFARRIEPGTTQHSYLLTKAARELNSALPWYRMAIEDITQENCTDIFTCSLILSLYTFADSTLEHKITSYRLSDAYRSANKTLMVTGLFRAMRGTFMVVNKCLPWILQGPLSNMVKTNDWCEGLVLDDILASGDDSKLARLAQLWSQSNPDDEDAQAFADAHWHLRYAFSVVTSIDASAEHLKPKLRDESFNPTQGSWRSPYSRAPDPGALFHFPISFKRHFMHLVDCQHPYAMILVAHFAVLLHRGRSYYWWLEGISELFVEAAREAIGEQMQSWIEWPVRVVLQNELEPFNSSQGLLPFHQSDP